MSKKFDFSEFTLDIPVINHPNLSKDQLLYLHIDTIKKFYQNNIYKDRIIAKINKFPHLRNSYYEYFEFLIKQGILEKNILQGA